MLSEKKLRQIVSEFLAEGPGPFGLEDIEGDVDELGMSFSPYSLEGLYKRIDPADSNIPIMFEDSGNHIPVKSIYLVQLDNGKRYILLGR